MGIIAGLIIVLNAIFLGMSMDSGHADEGVWLAISITFTVPFWAELLFKARRLGWREQYCGEGSGSNIFDAVLIFTDTVHILATFLKASFPKGSGIITVFRIIRVLRLTRLLRLFRAPVFTDLLAMVHGLMFGMTTLAWSLIFFV